MTRYALVLMTMILASLTTSTRAQLQCASDRNVTDPGCIVQIKQGVNLPPTLRGVRERWTKPQWLL